MRTLAALLFLLASSLPAQSPFVGTWEASEGVLELEARGEAFVGRFSESQRAIAGKVVDGKLVGKWRLPEGRQRAGEFELEVSEDGDHLTGRWRIEGRERWRGWRGVRRGTEAATFAWGSQREGPVRSGPLLGQVTTESVRVWAQGQGTAPLTLHILGPGGKPIDSVTETPAVEDYYAVTFLVRGLEPGTRYGYRLSSSHGRTAVGVFETAPTTSARRVRIAFGSCLRDYSNVDNPIFASILADDPDLMLMLGDNCYFGPADWSSAGGMVRARLRSRNHPGYRELARRVPFVAMWDDHDYGPDNSDTFFPNAHLSRSTFELCWPRERYGLEELPGVFGTVRYGPVEVFFTDGRTYRKRGFDYLGSAQREWLIGALVASDAPIKLICSGSQVLPDHSPLLRMGMESWRRDGPDDLPAVQAALEAENVTGVVFLSGDIHMANLLREKRPSGYVYWELTSSGLANTPTGIPLKSNTKHLLEEVYTRQNYGLVDVDLDRRGSEVILTVKGDVGDTLIQQAVDLGELRVR